MRTAQQAQQSRPYHLAITVGLIAYGVVHVLIAWIALQLAWGKTSEKASKDGALQELASKPFGGVLLWIVAVGLFALVVWKALELAYGHLDLQKKLSAIGRGAIYLMMSISAAKMAMGSGASKSGQKSLTANLMGHGTGRALIVLIGLVVIGIGIYEIYKSVTKKFVEDLTGGVSDSTILLGRLGYAAKGVAVIIIGGIFAWAAITYDSAQAEAGGLDSALRTLKDQPFGTALLTLMALGIACYGTYCFVWSRNAKH